MSSLANIHEQAKFMSLGHVSCSGCFDILVSPNGNLKCGNCRKICKAIECIRVLVPIHPQPDDMAQPVLPLSEVLAAEGREVIHYVEATNFDDPERVIDFYNT